MEWLSAENIVAVGTAVIGVVASAVMVWYERRVPRRKRIGYRVQMDNPIGDDVRSGRANVRLGLFDETPGMTDATLVLLRIENDGSQSIAGDDYTSRERHGRDANSGTRQVFQRRVLGRGEIANSSLDCIHKDDATAPVVRCELDSTEQVLSTVAGLPGAIGYSELNLATGYKGLHQLTLDGHTASVEDLEHGTSSYPYREIEYAYTYGQPPADSLASSFLTYISRGNGQDVIRTHGHLPCGTPVGLKICGTN
ncbi:hypothetical protein ACFWAN_19500 [Streptomyces mirabilis]|uniref:hypothetical protein n=1 Tax=Streptomyces mirabilis TaxID=68239 RepID=UPI003654D161